MILNHVFVKLKSKTSNTRNKIGDVRASDRRMSQPSSYIVLLFQLQLHVAEGGLGGSAPQQEIKLKLCPTKLKFALAYFNHIYRSYK